MNKSKNNKKNLKNAFTIVEVSILFVIFLIVAFLVAPLSLDDTIQAKNASKWRRVQSDFMNIYYSINTQREMQDFDFVTAFESVMSGEIKGESEPYKITYMNGTFPSTEYRFSNYKLTYSNNIVAYRIYEAPQSDALGVIMYDVNGKAAPNVWGRDVFGYNIYPDRFEPFCKNDPITTQKQDCSKSGTGLCCSNYYLIGGSFH